MTQWILLDGYNYLYIRELDLGFETKIIHQEDLKQKYHTARQCKWNSIGNNGKRFSTKQTRHINIQHFYIADKVKGGGIQIVH